MLIRLAKKQDILEMLEIIKQTFSKSDFKFAKKEFEEIFSKALNKPRYLLAIEKNKIIGFAGFAQSWLDFNVYEIFWVAVNPKYQGKGIGQMIVKEVINKIKKIKGYNKAKMIVLTTAVDGFFKKCGFKTIASVNRNKDVLMAIKL